MPSIVGWDIGGVNTKAALVVDGELRDVQTRPFELQREPQRLSELLLAAAASLGADRPRHAVTMTAELSQMFRTKRSGVTFVLDAVAEAFPGADIQVYTTDGEFVSPAVARQRPLRVAASNWMATAQLVSRYHRDALLIDIGTTTTDIIPIVSGRVAAVGRTDLDRLASGELVYTGSVRTPVEAMVRQVPVPGAIAAVSAEGFALSGDVHVWLGALDATDYEAATPDGRPSTREFAGERLCRVVCADRDMLDAAAITVLAQAVADEQVQDVAAALRRVMSRHPSLTTAITTGLGAFIGERAARAAGLDVVPMASHLGVAGARNAPASAVALLLHARVEPLTVIKIGGSQLANLEQWRATLETIVTLAESQRLVLVPGGGPFADQVRELDARTGLPDATAHWLAIGGMDQHAELITSVDARLVRVTDCAGVAAAHAQGHVPVLAPSAWLRASDPLPHSWDVTSDSIAAWIAGELEATRLVLVKPAGASGLSCVDPSFVRSLPTGLPWTTVSATELVTVLGPIENVSDSR